MEICSINIYIYSEDINPLLAKYTEQKKRALVLSISNRIIKEKEYITFNRRNF